MEPKQFIEKLQEVAVIEHLVPKTIKENHETVQEPEEIKYMGEVVEISRDYNPTLGIKITKVKEPTQACSLGCGKIVTGQVVENKWVTYPYGHWRTRCVNCSCYPLPDGTGFVDNPASILSEESKYATRVKYGLAERRTISNYEGKVNSSSDDN